MLTLCYSILDQILYVDVSLRQNLSLRDTKMSRLIGIVVILYLPEILVYISSMSVNCMQMDLKVDIRVCVSRNLELRDCPTFKTFPVVSNYPHYLTIRGWNYLDIMSFLLNISNTLSVLWVML